jgi:hypothetical protein
MKLTFDRASGALESHRDWVFNNDAFLENAAGERIDSIGLETTEQTEDSIGVLFVYDLPQGFAGHVFVYRTPTDIIRQPLPYELTNIELP